MLLSVLSRFRLGSVAAAACSIAVASAMAANTAEAPSLAEYITAICSTAFLSAPPAGGPIPVREPAMKRPPTSRRPV